MFASIAKRTRLFHSRCNFYCPSRRETKLIRAAGQGCQRCPRRTRASGAAQTAQGKETTGSSAYAPENTPPLIAEPLKPRVVPLSSSMERKSPFTYNTTFPPVKNVHRSSYHFRGSHSQLRIEVGRTTQWGKLRLLNESIGSTLRRFKKFPVEIGRLYFSQTIVKAHSSCGFHGRERIPGMCMVSHGRRAYTFRETYDRELPHFHELLFNTTMYSNRSIYEVIGAASMRVDV